MSQYAYLACEDCKQITWLGKALFDASGSLQGIHRGSPEEAPNFMRPELNRRLWSFLVLHFAHRLRGLMDHEIEKYEDIDGDD